MVERRIVLLALLTAALVQLGNTKAVNISNVWLLPEEGYPVFYRYFRDRITWFEADAVCQFHHANLVTVDSSEQYDATRAYLKELDVTSNVWVGLKRSGAEGEFMWTDYKPLENGGYWQEQIPMTDNPVCAALDPTVDFRWHPLTCGGPAVASFICQLEVPAWARKEDGCMVTSLPSLTVSYLPEQGAVELISDCGLDGTRRIACKGQANRDEMMRQLSCESSTEGQTEIPASTTWDEELPTRHRRDTEITVDVTSHKFEPTTEGLTVENAVEVTKDSPPAEQTEIRNLAQPTNEVTTTQGLPQEMSVAEEPIKRGLDVLTDETYPSLVKPNLTLVPVKKDKGVLLSIGIPLNSIAQITSEEDFSGVESKHQVIDRRGMQTQSKPIPPSLRGNSPFIEPAANKSLEDLSKHKVEEKESHEVFRESNLDLSIQPDKKELKLVTFHQIPVFNSNQERDPDEDSSRTSDSNNEHKGVVGATNSFIATTATTTKHQETKNETKFFTRVIVEDGTVNPTMNTTPTTKQNTDNDFFVVTEVSLNLEKNMQVSKELPNRATPIHFPLTTSKSPTTQTSVKPLSKSTVISNQEMADEPEPEAPERPNRGRLLVKPQHRSFYPYFLNRVLG